MINARACLILLLSLLAPLPSVPAHADAPENYELERSPNRGWDEDMLERKAEGERTWVTDAALWLPNRVLDLIDVFRFDVGVGPTLGGVVRVSKYAQVGMRTVAPFSARVGAFGREFPAKIESSSEFGISPAYKESKDRPVCSAEVGIGIDIVAGVYGGICFDELVDFVGGIFLLDPKHDDLG